MEPRNATIAVVGTGDYIGAAPTPLIADINAAGGADRRAMRSVERGAFGSSTFFVGDEIFFGEDRLRDAWKQSSALAQARRNDP